MNIELIIDRMFDISNCLRKYHNSDCDIPQDDEDIVVEYEEKE